MSQLLKLLEELNMPKEVIEGITNTPSILSMEEPEIIKLLLNPKEFEAGYTRLREISANPNGYYILSVMLKASLETRKKYREKSIPDEIFLATMGCFKRFILENKKAFDRYFFDRGFWTGRQTSMLLFRLGELEFERYETKGEKMIYIHIPSDAIFTPERVDFSLSLARDFIKKFYPDFNEAKYYCASWLLSPSLEQLLPPNSNVVSFQKRFKVLSFNEDSESYKQWVFLDKNAQPVNFKTDTSLQRNIKRFVLEGGKIGEAFGVLK